MSKGSPNNRQKDIARLLRDKGSKRAGGISKVRYSKGIPAQGNSSRIPCGLPVRSL